MKNSQTWHPAHIRAHRNLSPTVREFEIRPEGGVKPWTVGSHLKVQVLVDGREETRSYSLVGLHDKDVYRIAVKRAEPSRGGSRYLWGLEAGAELMIGEPNNHFELAFNAPQFLLVAGGIGITPLVGMAQMLAGKGADVRMCYAARSADEVVLGDVLRQSLGDRLQTFCSDATALNLDAEIAALARARRSGVRPDPLLEAVRDAWARPPARAPTCLRDLRHSGHHGPAVLGGRPRLRCASRCRPTAACGDVLNEAGWKRSRLLPRRVRAVRDGRVVGAGEIDHRDVFLSPHEHKAASACAPACRA